MAAPDRFHQCLCADDAPDAGTAIGYPQHIRSDGVFKKRQAMNLLEKYRAVRAASEAICQPLQKEDYVVQPIVDVSPPKWHRGHITWFWEAFVLIPHQPGYRPYNPDYNYVFNSYYETIGARVVRTDRGNLSRPSVDEGYAYRRYVDEQMAAFIQALPDPSLEDLVVLGLNHEQQHQELLYSDIKYIL